MSTTGRAGGPAGYALAAPGLTSPALIARERAGWAVRLTGRLGEQGYEFLGRPHTGGFDGARMLTISFGHFAGPGAAHTFVRRLAGPARLGIRYPDLMGSLPRASCALGLDVEPMAAVRAAASLFFDVEGGGRRIDVHEACERASLTPVMTDPSDGREYEAVFEGLLAQGGVEPLPDGPAVGTSGIRIVSDRRLSVAVYHLAQEKVADSERGGDTPTLTYAVIPTLAPRRPKGEPDALRQALAGMMGRKAGSA